LLPGCGGKPAWQNKNRMSANRSFEEFAARLRVFFRFSIPERVGDGTIPQPEAGPFDKLAGDLFALQFDHNPAYRRFCEARATSPASLAHWSQIPAMPAVAFKETDLSCLPPDRRDHVFLSSGTTAQRPSRHFHNAASLAIYEASLLPWFRAHLLPEGPDHPWPMICLTPSPASAPHSSLVHMLETVRRRFGSADSVFVGTVAPDGAWVLDAEAALSALRRALEQSQPVVLLGTAFSLVHLLDLLRARQLTFNLPPGSRMMETGGYKGRSRAVPKAQLDSLISARLGIPLAKIVSEYGMSELSSQAYDHDITADPTRARAFRFPPWVRLQLISPETGLEAAPGETGLLRVFDLANVYSVMAIQTEDLGSRRGDGFSLAGRAPLAEPRGCSLMAS
jgi:hypothetical protein